MYGVPPSARRPRGELDIPPAGRPPTFLRDWNNVVNLSDVTRAMMQDGWRIEYSDEGVIAYLNCRWCKGKRKAMKRCALCKGTGAERTRRLL